MAVHEGAQAAQAAMVGTVTEAVIGHATMVGRTGRPVVGRATASRVRNRA
jgi:hypothetical protein